jgi:DNA-binding NtrC family response regulator
MNQHSILVVDDDASLRRIIEFNLKKRSYKTITVESGEKALESLRKNDFCLLISDIKMAGMDGIQLMQKAREIKSDLPVIFITAFGTIEMAVEAMKLGAFDYITKPFDLEDFLHTVEKALEYHRLVDENIRLKHELKSRDSFSNIIGSSKAMQAVFGKIEKIANTDVTILISGESGTGKELIARALHQQSGRSDKPMVTVNCAAIPKDLLESELFGHVSGAFTGAVKNKTGKFELADGSTIFLDEIGDMSLELQAKLLRVLENRTIEPLGSNESIPVDIRVLAATNHNLQENIQSGKFREDLYYRLNVIPIHIPPLRERPEDIPLLVNHFLKEFAPERQVSIDRNAREIIKNYEWPGNVRELKNLIKRLVVLAEDDKIEAGNLPDEIIHKKEIKQQNHENGRPENVSLEETEKRAILEALEKSGWNQTKAARLLEIPRHVLIYRIKKYNISEP